MANLTLEDIANISFPRANFGGYRAEDVDAFIDDVQVSYDNVLKESAELKRKLAILAQKVEEYRNEEDSIRNTLLSAQKLADASVREAKHKAEVIVADATEKAERIILGAQKEADSQKGELGRLKEEVAAFRTKLLTVYKEHLQIIQQLPVEEETVKEKEAQAAEPAEEPEASQPEAPQKTAGEETAPEIKAQEVVAADPKDLEKARGLYRDADAPGSADDAAGWRSAGRGSAAVSFCLVKIWGGLRSEKRRRGVTHQQYV